MRLSRGATGLSLCLAVVLTATLSSTPVMFVPVGFFLSLVLLTRLLWIALPIVPALSSVLETLQFLLLPARRATDNDVVAHTIGGWLGVAGAALTVVAVHIRDRRVIQRWRERNEIGVRETLG